MSDARKLRRLRQRREARAGQRRSPYQFNDGHCHVCGAELHRGDDVASYDALPQRGLMHWRCLLRNEGITKDDLIELPPGGC